MIRNYQGTEAERGINFKLPGASFLFFFSPPFREHTAAEKAKVFVSFRRSSPGGRRAGGGGGERGAIASLRGVKRRRRGEGEKKKAHLGGTAE